LRDKRREIREKRKEIRAGSWGPEPLAAKVNECLCGEWRWRE
jgi:hypothetical protein